MGRQTDGLWAHYVVVGTSWHMDPQVFQHRNGEKPDDARKEMQKKNRGGFGKATTDQVPV